MRIVVLALLVAACGGGDGAGIDAGPPDAPAVPDAAPPDASPPDASPPDVLQGPLPDLELVGEETVMSMYQDTQFFNTNSCSLDEMCVGAPGTRELLRFDVVNWNRGPVDLVVGTPGGDPTFWMWSDCHGHYHFRDYAIYELVGPTGVVATGRKQAFCLEDTDQVDPMSPGPNYDCGFQGITAGWADRYSTALPCQWIDVTDVAPGDYTLRVSVNYEHVLLESNYDNNIFETPVTIN